MNNENMTSIEWLIEQMLVCNYISKKQCENASWLIDEAKQLQLKQSQEYAKFAILCDRKGIKILDFDGFIKL